MGVMAGTLRPVTSICCNSLQADGILLVMNILFVRILKPAFFISACVATALLASCSKPQPPNLLVNSGFEEQLENKKPVAWRTVQHAGKAAYKYDVDAEVFVEGIKSYRIEQYAKQAYGMVKQTVVLPEGENKTFSLTAMLKVKDIAVGEGLKLVLNCRGSGNAILKQYKSPPLTGTADWLKVTLEGEIPKGTVRFGVGIMLQSVGVAWVDDTYLSINRE